MSTEVTPETSRQAHAEKGVARLDSLGPWYGATAAYLAVSALFLFVRRSEFGFGCEASDPKCGSLQLNDIGDVAAGIFAPLAFLWLFVATQLQRKELRLQRAELAETRSVLAGQQIELEKAAEESNRQTEIMRETLASATARSDYEAFSYNLYLICRRSYRAKERIIITKKGNAQLFKFYPELFLSENDNSILDTFIENLYENIHTFRVSHSTIGNTPDFRDRDTLVTIATLRFLSESLFEIVRGPEFRENSLVKLRVHGLPLAALIEELKAVLEWSDKGDPANALEQDPLQ